MKPRNLLCLISLGAVLEYYDFGIYIYLAKAIGGALIPEQNPSINLILSYLILAIGALVRPLGGIIFAHFGDTSGRSKTFIMTILVMAIPTLAIAFIPGSSQIGIWAVILLIVFRIIQGFAIGGEVPGAIVFGYEIAPKEYRPIYTAIVIFGVNVGFVLSSFVSTIIIKEPNQMAWRMAFIIGGVFGIVNYFLRKKIVESPEFLRYQATIAKKMVPIKILIAQHYKTIWQLLGIGAFFASAVAVYTFYMPVYLATFYHLPLASLMHFNSYAILLFMLGSLVAGIWHKYFGRRFFLVYIPIFIICTAILFRSYPELQLKQIYVIHSVMLFALGVVSGRMPVLCAAFFPVQVRYSGVALVYNISFGVVAGITQVLLAWLIKLTNIIWLPGIYVVICGICALIAVISINGRAMVTYD